MYIYIYIYILYYHILWYNPKWSTISFKQILPYTIVYLLQYHIEYHHILYQIPSDTIRYHQILSWLFLERGSAISACHWPVALALLGELQMCRVEGAAESDETGGRSSFFWRETTEKLEKTERKPWKNWDNMEKSCFFWWVQQLGKAMWLHTVPRLVHARRTPSGAGPSTCCQLCRNGCATRASQPWLLPSGYD